MTVSQDKISPEVPNAGIAELGLPLCVDLDGTLILTDIFVESLLLLLKTNIFYLFLIPIWLLRGRANLKYQIAKIVEIDVSILPYNQPLLEYLREQHKSHRRLVLCTASNQKYADKVAAHIGIFSDVIASDEQKNIKGRAKRDILVSLFGDKGFDYAANSKADLVIWEQSRHAITVNCSTSLQNTARNTVHIIMDFPRTGFDVRIYCRAIRVYQWAKNLLIFLPLLASQNYRNLLDVELSIIAFLSFCLCASSVYVLNDLLDLEADRHHPRKKYRPFASAQISPIYGLCLIPIMLSLSGLLASFLPSMFVALLFCYVTMSFTYSLFLKRIPILDALVLAGLYTLRILAGATAINVVTSFWLLSFSMFFFLSIALAKRYSELLDQEILLNTDKTGRRYRAEDLNTLISQGSSSGHVAVLVLALYINSDEVLLHYRTPVLLWFICPLLLYWISKLWLNAQRREIKDDPLVWAISNRVSRVIAIFIIVILILAI